MLAWLRRRQPRQPVLAVLYWLMLIVLTLAALTLIFFQVDRLLPPLY